MKAALYGRYSTDHQRSASIEDQFRNAERRAEQLGFEIVARFKDAALSGTKRDRPGYQALLAAAKRREFEVLLIDDLSRLSRDSLDIQRVVRLLESLEIRLIGVSDGIDTAMKGQKFHTALRGIINETYLEDLREKTRRGLEGIALEGKSTGGRVFGYRAQPIPHEDYSGARARP